MKAAAHLALALALATGGCSRESGPRASEAPSSPASASTGPRPDEQGMPAPLPMPVIEKICAAAPCSGPFSRIEVWRTREGKIGAFYHHGDVQRCSHPPSVYFDAQGATLETVPLEPVVPGSDEAKRFAAIHEKHTRGLVKSETTTCQGRTTR